MVFRGDGGFYPVVRYRLAVRPPSLYRPYRRRHHRDVHDPRQIEWEAILYADDFYFRGQYWVRLLLESNYKPQLIRPAWFWRFDRLYESKGVKAVYLRTMGLEIDSMQLVALIRRMKEADVPGRIELLNGCLLK